MPDGYLSLVLHAHLPYVRHPENPDTLEEHWLHLCLTESYLPLLESWETLVAEGFRLPLTLSLSPTLVTMLADPLLQERYVNWMQRRIALAEAEAQRSGEPWRDLAVFYRDRFRQLLERYENLYERNVIGAFQALMPAGLELATTAATHGYLPLLAPRPETVRAQVATGRAAFRELTGVTPAGFWLPECGFEPELEALLARQDVHYTWLETHGVAHGEPMPRYGIYTPVEGPAGVMFFGRDPESSRQVWSGQSGYPGDFNYREFHCDLSTEADPAQLTPCLLQDGTPVPSGLKYYRITGGKGEKAPYEPTAARRRACSHARDFLEKKRAQVRRLKEGMDQPPVITAPYDCELFGHWWYEGPVWLESLIREAASTPELELTTPKPYLDRFGSGAAITPSASSWGDQGYNRFWLNEETQWIYPHLFDACERLQQNLQHHYDNLAAGSPLARAFQQAARTLLLAQASDWPFILRAGTTVDYARRRLEDLLARFNYLDTQIRENRIDNEALSGLEEMDRIFPGIDPRLFLSEPSDSGDPSAS